MDIQLFQHHFVEMAVLPLLNFIFTFANNQLGIFMWVCFLYSVPLIVCIHSDNTTLLITAIIQQPLILGKVIPPPLFFFTMNFLCSSRPVPFRIHFRIRLSFPTEFCSVLIGICLQISLEKTDIAIC